MTIASTLKATIDGRTAFLFPGQGSQKVGMLAELAEQFGLIQQTFDEASAALGFDVWHIAQSGEQLDQTAYTQPVLLTASIALWRLWRELGGAAPAVLAGHSLGEYSALVAAGVLTLAQASAEGTVSFTPQGPVATPGPFAGKFDAAAGATLKGFKRVSVAGS